MRFPQGVSWPVRRPPGSFRMMAVCALAAGLALAACTMEPTANEPVQPLAAEGTTTATGTQAASTATVPAPARTPDRSQLPVTPPALDLVPTTPPPVVGEVPPDLLAKIIADLEGRLGPGGPAITVTRAEAVVWNDGSLGCPQPGVLYTQALVNGYWAVFVVGEQEYDYRVVGTGYFFLCERGSRPVPPPGTPDS